MKAKAVLLMLLITFISYTGFASHSDPGQNSEVKTLVLTSDYAFSATQTLNDSFELQLLTAIPENGFISFVNASDSGIVYSAPPDTLCHKIDAGKLNYIRTDTLLDKGLLIDKYRYRQAEFIRIRKIPEKHTAKPRDKIQKQKR